MIYRPMQYWLLTSKIVLYSFASPWCDIVWHGEHNCHRIMIYTHNMTGGSSLGPGSSTFNLIMIWESEIYEIYSWPEEENSHSQRSCVKIITRFLTLDHPGGCEILIFSSSFIICVASYPSNCTLKSFCYPLQISWVLPPEPTEHSNSTPTLILFMTVQISFSKAPRFFWIISICFYQGF